MLLYMLIVVRRPCLSKRNLDPPVMISSKATFSLILASSGHGSITDVDALVYKYDKRLDLAMRHAMYLEYHTFNP